MLTSDSIDLLASALSKAQGEFTPASRSGFNLYHESAYSTLSDVLTACRAPLAKNGLAIIQTTEPTDKPDTVTITTRLMHESGQWVEGVLAFPVINSGKGEQRLPPNAQSYMSAMTYARRAGLAAIVGVAPDSDDDGNSASGRAAKGAAASSNSMGGSDVTEAQRSAIKRLCKDQGIELPNFGEMTMRQASNLITELNKTPAAAAAKN